MSRQYYYLVASLPQLRLDDYKIPYRVNDFINEIAGALTEEHRVLVRDIMSFYDHADVIDRLKGAPDAAAEKDSAHEQSAAGLFSEDEERPFYGYLDEFQEAYRDKKTEEIPQRIELEHLLLDIFYRRMLGSPNHFVREYFLFDLTLRNILVDLNLKRFQPDGSGYIALDALGDAGDGQTGEIPKHLFRGAPYLTELEGHFEHNDIVRREHFIDQLRWKAIDDINTFSYFDIDILLGHLVRLLLLERWIALDPQRGRDIFNERIQTALSEHH
ncbi:MAG: DUF2764 family protein [Candidatus Omnitrophica bacterium]|nr:DUF2764 family protein [Candidatus Omnitrophota bacterium]